MPELLGLYKVQGGAGVVPCGYSSLFQHQRAGHKKMCFRQNQKKFTSSQSREKSLAY